MTKYIKLLLFISIFIAGAFIAPKYAFAANCTSAGSGNWTTITWTNCASGPQSTDDVTIAANTDVTLDTSTQITNLIFAANANQQNSSLTHSSTNSLTITGAVTMNQATSNNQTAAWNINAGSATVTSGITMTEVSTQTSRTLTIAITSGTLNANGGLTAGGTTAASKIINMSGGTGTLNLKGAIATTGGTGADGFTFTMGTSGSNFNYTDTSAQTIFFPGSGAYNNLGVSNSAGATLNGAVTTSNVTGNITVSGSGVLKNGGNAIAGTSSKTFQVNNGATFEMSGTSSFPTGFTTFTFQSTSTVKYLQTQATAISAQTYGHLTLTPSASTITFTFATGTTTVAGTLTTGVNGAFSAATITAATNSTTLDINGTGGVVIGANSTLVAHASNAFTVFGDWTNNGTFTSSGGTVTFDGTSTQTLSGTMTGSSAFGGLTITNSSGSVSGCSTSFTPGIDFAAAATITTFTISTSGLSAGVYVEFESGATYTVTTASWNGASGKLIYLRNSNLTSGTWSLVLTNQPTVTYVDVARSAASGAGSPVLATDETSTDCGSNSGWTFPAHISVSGHIYTDEVPNALDCSTPRVVRIRVNGSSYTTTVNCSNSPDTGSYNFSSVTVSAVGDVLTVYLDGETEKATTVTTIADTVSNITDVDLYQNRVIVRNEDTGAINNTDLDKWDSGDEGDTIDGDIGFTVTSGNATFSNTRKLIVWGGENYTPGGTVTTNSGGSGVGGDLQINTSATLDMEANTLSFGGAAFTNNGTFSQSSNTVTFAGTAAQDIAGSSTTTFNNLTVTNSAGEITASTDFNVTGTLNINHASAVVNIGASRVINSGGAQGTITGTGTVKVSSVTGTNDFAAQYKFTTYTLTNLTTDFTGTGGDIDDKTYGGLKVSGSVTAATSPTVGGALNVIGTLTPSSGTVTMNDTSSIANSGTLTFSNLTINTGATVTTSSSFTINGALTNSSTATFNPSAGTITMATTGWSIVNSGSSLIFSGLTISETPSTQPTSSFSVSGALTVNSAKTLAPTSGTITMTGGSIVNNGGAATNLVFNNLTVSGSTTANSQTFNIAGTTSITGTLTVSSGSGTITAAGDVTGTGTMSLTSGTFVQSVAAGQQFGPTSTNDWTFNTLTFSSSSGSQIITTSSTSTGKVAVGATLTISANTELDAANRTWNLSATGTPFVISGTFTANTSTFNYLDTTGPTVTGTTYYNLGVGTNANATATTFALGGDTTVGGVLTVGDAASSANDTLDASTATLTLSGTNGDPFLLTSFGLFEKSTSTVDYTGNNTGGDTTIQTATYNNLRLGGASAENYVPEGAITASGTLTLNANGTLGGAQNVTVNEDVTGSGTITLTGGTFEHQVAANQNFGTSSGTNSWTFATLTFSNSSGVNRTITTPSGSGGITASTLLQIGKAGDTNATILDAANRTWTLSGTNGTPFNIVSPSDNTSLTASTSTFSYTGANGGGNTTIQDATYYNLTVNASDTFVLEATPLTVNSDLTVTSGTLSLAGNSLNVGLTSVTDSGDISVSGTLTQTSSATTTVKTSASGAASIGGSGTLTFYNLTVAPTAASATITLGSGASQTITVSNNLIFGDGTAVTVTAATNNPTITVSGNFTNSSNSSFTSTSGNFSVGGSWTNSGSFDNNSGTVTMTSTSIGKTLSGTLTGSTGKFNHIQFNGSGGEWTFNAAAEAGGNFTITLGTVITPSSTLTITGNFAHDGGSFTHNSGTVVFTPNTTSQITGATTFNDLNNITAGSTLEFEASTIFTFAGTLTVTGASGNRIHIHSTTGSSQWLAQFSNAQSSVTFAHISYAGCDTGTQDITLATNNINDGNNDSCWVFLVPPPQVILEGGINLRGGTRLGQ